MKPDFTNTETAFRHFTNKDLKRAIFLFSFITKPFWVKTGKFFLSVARTLHIPYGWAVKKNVFRHFCAGENISQCLTVIQKLAAKNCYSILDYSAEGIAGEENFDDVCKEIISGIDMAEANKNIAFGVFKFTGMADFSLIEKKSSGQPLSEEESKRWEKSLARAKSVISAGAAIKLPVFIDAEETWIQPAIDMMALELMKQYNHDHAVVFTTIQMYRTDGLEKVRQLIESATESGFIAGVKLVRGAYMEKERARAAAMGYPSPIHPSKTDTDKAFNDAVALCISNPDKINVCIATHNERSSSMAAEIMSTYQLNNNDIRIWFAQLYGMSDHITFNLSNSGFNTAKYLPYGPVEKVLPYLIRRAEENSSVADQSNREIRHFQAELKRRKLSGKSTF
jgi:proline dehydrogenase